MELEKLINEDLKQAMLAKDKRKLGALRAIKAALLLAKTDKGQAGTDIPEEAELKILQKLVKQRKESAEIYKNSGRNDLAEEESYQAGIIEQYLPRQLSKEEIRIAIEQIINDTGATTIKDMGKVMGVASKQLAGKADNKVISGLVKELLGI